MSDAPTPETVETPDLKIFSQLEVNALMEKHRKGLQKTIKDQEFRISYLEDQVRLLSKLDYNPLARLIMAECAKREVSA